MRLSFSCGRATLVWGIILVCVLVYPAASPANDMSPPVVNTKEEIMVILPNNTAISLVLIPAGSFEMGARETERGHRKEETPAHTVTIGYDFYIGRYEITQKQWLAIMGKWPEPAMMETWDTEANNESPILKEVRFEPREEWGIGDDYPAYNVSWHDAKQFIEALNLHLKKTGQGHIWVRLPSEAEWEYACRAGTTTRFFFGDSLEAPDNAEDDGTRGRYMWYKGNNVPYGSKPVGAKLPNPWGLYDMYGNVYEWCEDDWHSEHEDAPANGSARINSPRGKSRVIRGGGWHDAALGCRSARRSAAPGEVRTACLGFRIVGDLRAAPL